jgi:hypothetical protein
MFVSFNSITTSAISEADTAYPSGEPDITGV